ncbi:MAG: phage tail assembly protein [Rickettsia endosymbiont of Ixodes persulcatus]|nr:phage tail assembly protein [Rickettsia endosymbiont of Ixodes persulcatus]
MQHETEYPLAYPIVTNGLKTLSLKIRRPTVGDNLAADSLQESDSVKEMYLIANLCQISTEDVKNLDLKDYKKIQAIIESFLA